MRDPVLLFSLVNTDRVHEITPPLPILWCYTVNVLESRSILRCILYPETGFQFYLPLTYYLGFYVSLPIRFVPLNLLLVFLPPLS